MAETVSDINLCMHCGADVRPDTQFCYNCGKSVEKAEAGNVSDGKGVETNESLLALEKALAESRPASNPKAKLESAAAERRRARGVARKPIEIAWDPSEPGLVYFITAAVIFIVVAVVVFLMRSAR